MPGRFGPAAARSQVGQDASSQRQVVMHVIGERVEHGPVLPGRAECALTQQRGQVADVSINTVTKLLADVGAACSEFQDKTMRDLTLMNVQVDEIWAFIGAKQKPVPADADPTLGLGDCYTFTAIDRATKLMPCYMLGYRTAECAEQFMQDLASRLASRVQLTTDGLNAYPDAVEKSFGADVDYAVLNKTYEGGRAYVEAKRRYSPAVCVGATKIVVPRLA